MISFSDPLLLGDPDPLKSVTDPVLDREPRSFLFQHYNVGRRPVKNSVFLQIINICTKKAEFGRKYKNALGLFHFVLTF
jgi:hypothetical protein